MSTTAPVIPLLAGGKIVYATNYTASAGPDSVTSRFGDKAIDLVLYVQAEVDTALLVGNPIPESVFVPEPRGNGYVRFNFAREEARGIYYTLVK